jgi:hypothetical protein
MTGKPSIVFPLVAGAALCVVLAVSVRQGRGDRPAPAPVARVTGLAGVVGDAQGGAGWRFEAFDLWVNVGVERLATYQCDVSVRSGEGRFVGIEGGEEGVFQDPPSYDPRAMARERAVLAAFTLEGAEALPRGRVRVARLMLETRGERPAELEAVLVLAGGAQGQRVGARVELTRASR